MVETNIDEKTGLSTIVLKPNNSASWQLNLQIFGALAVVAFGIAMYFALMGLWMVLPFAGLEFAFLFICLYLRLRANLCVEVITFDKDNVIVERGYYHAEKTWKYHRTWSKIFVKNPPWYGHPKKIFIRSHGKELELGSFLNKQDKELLINDLKKIIYA